MCDTESKDFYGKLLEMNGYYFQIVSVDSSEPIPNVTEIRIRCCPLEEEDRDYIARWMSCITNRAYKVFGVDTEESEEFNDTSKYRKSAVGIYTNGLVESELQVLDILPINISDGIVTFQAREIREITND